MFASITTTNTTTTDNETVSDDNSTDGDADEGIEDTIGEGFETVTDFVKNLSWKSIVALIGGLAVVGGVVWYFLKDKRKKYIELKVKIKGNGEEKDVDKTKKKKSSEKK